MIRSLLAVVAAFLSLVTLGGAVAADHYRDPVPAPVAVPVPSLTDVSATSQTPTLFTVTGKDFTSGGRVYLAVYDQMGAKLYETRWVTATSAPIHGPGDSLPNAQGPEGPGGTLREAFGQLCGATAMMRALDEQTAVWSNWLTVQFACNDGVGPSRTAGTH
jgi:hypothetical protein